MAVCPKCKAELEHDSKFCDICGFELAKAESNCEKTRLKKRSLKKWLIISGSALVSAAAVIIALILILPSSVPQYIFYIKDGDLYYADLDKNKKYELSDDLDASYSYTVLSEDGKRVFYYDKYDSDDGTYSLYYRDVKDIEKQPTKLDSGVNDVYYVNDSGDKVTYLKDGSLYQHDLKEKSKISNNVVSFAVSPNGKSIVYIDEQKDVYFSDVKSSYKVASGIDKFIYLTDDYKTFYYLKENTLYKQTNGEDNVRIAKDVLYVLNVYDSGEILYIKASQTRYKCSDYIHDNAAAADAAIQAPIAPDPNTTFSEYHEKYVAYKALQEKYIEKLDRDTLRHEMETETFSLSLNCLYCYDENGERMIADNVSGYMDVSDKYPVAVISVIDVAALSKVNITALKSIEELENRISSSFYDARLYALANSNGYSKLSKNAISNFTLSDDGKYACYSIPSTYGTGNLFRVEIGETISEPKVYANVISGVGPKYSYVHDGSGDYVELYYCLEPDFLNDGKIYYAKNEDSKTNRFDVFVGEECIAESVSYVVKDASRNNTLYYFDNYDADNETASLKIYKDGKTETISNEVHFDYLSREHCLELLSDGSVLYFSSDKDELMYYNGKESIKIDHDVEFILPPYDFEHTYEENRKLNVETLI